MPSPLDDSTPTDTEAERPADIDDDFSGAGTGATSGGGSRSGGGTGSESDADSGNDADSDSRSASGTGSESDADSRDDADSEDDDADSEDDDSDSEDDDSDEDDEDDDDDPSSHDAIRAAQQRTSDGSERATIDEVAIVTALTRLEQADAQLRGRLRARFGVGGTDLAAIQYIARGDAAGRPVRVKDLADVLCISSASATELMQRLERAGHVFREVDPDDRRNRLLCLTDSAAATLGDAFGGLQEQIRAALSTAPPTVRQQIVATLDSISRTLRGQAVD